MSEEFVLKHLKWPDDASFPFGSKTASLINYDRGKDWVVIGKVKAKNAFGAELTHRYQAQLRHLGNQRWKARYVKIGDNIAWFDPEWAAEVLGDTQSAKNVIPRSPDEIEAGPVVQSQPVAPPASDAPSPPSEAAAGGSVADQPTKRHFGRELTREERIAALWGDEATEDEAAEEATGDAAEEATGDAAEKKATGDGAAEKAEKETAEWRTWTDATGSFTVEARFSGIIAGKVLLKTRDGRRIYIEPAKLSEADQKFIEAKIGK